MEEFWTGEFTKAVNGQYGQIESLSGSGSALGQTKAIRERLTLLLKELQISSLIDVPCGDLNWMRLVDLGECKYTGIDIIKPLVDRNSAIYGTGKHPKQFLHLDVRYDSLPNADLILCRDLLVHMSEDDVYKALDQFKRSGAKYLLTTTFPKRAKNQVIESGAWRPINLQAEPFNFPVPVELINENCTEQNGIYNDKSLGLWKLQDLQL